jgi:hypothetical protein
MNNMYDILDKMKLLEGRSSKPDFPDIDGDGDRREPISKAAQEMGEASYSAKAARAGKDIGKPGKNFEKIAKSAAERYGSKEKGEKVAGAVLAKLRAKESIEEGDVEEGNDFTKARLDAIKAGKPTFRLNGKTYKVTGDTSDEQRMDEGYVDFMDKKEMYRKIGADVEGKADDYTVTFKDGSRKRYQELNGRRRVTTLEPVDAPEETDDEGNVVKRGRGRPKGSKHSLGAKGPTGRSKLMRMDESHYEVGDEVICKQSGMSGKIVKVDKPHGAPDEKYYTFRREDGKVIKKAPNELRAVTKEDYDKDEYDEEGEMAKSQARTIEDAAKELQDILDDDENLPEWVQKKITLALDYIDSARDYMKANPDEEEVEVEVDDEEFMAEKAVSKAQRAAAGIAYAAKKGDISKSELRGASKEMAKMPAGELKKFAKTKEKGLPEKKDEAVEETTVAGSVATAEEAPKSKKGGMQFGKGVYEGQIAESFERKLNMLTEGMSINMSVDETGKKNLSVTASDDDAVKLAQILKLAGMESAEQYHDACPSCGEMHEGRCRMEEDLANSADDTEVMDTDYITNTISGGLNGPKLQVNPNNPGDNPLAMRNLGKGPSGQVNLGAMAEDIEQKLETRLMDLYKRIS